MKLSQTDKVREILKREGSISNHWAIDTRLTTRLGAIVFRLRQEGMDIRGEYSGDRQDFVYTYKRKPKAQVEYVERDGVMYARMMPLKS